MESHDSKLHYGHQMEGEALHWFQGRFPSARLLARNYRIRGGELDLVLEEAREAGPELVFIEVRARKMGSLQSGIESLGLAKLFRLRRTIRHFLWGYRGPAQSLRLDVLSWDGGIWTHYPNIRLPE